MVNTNRNPYSIKVFTCLKNIDELLDIFNRATNLVSNSTTLAPSLQKYWLRAFLLNYGDNRNLAITIVFEGNIPHLIMPLQIKGRDRLEFLCNETSDYNDFLSDEVGNNTIKYALEYWVAKGIQHICLNRLPTDSKTIQLLNAIATELHWGISIRDCDTIPVVFPQLNKEIQDWSGVKSEQVKRYKRKLNALSKISSPVFSCIETKSQLIDEFPIIKRMHVDRWNSIGIQSKYSDQRRESFIINVCEEAINNNALFFPIMKINDVLISFIIGFRYGDTIFDWNTSFSIEYHHWSPGALLLLHVLSNPKTYNFTKYNLMKGTEHHKYIWTNRVEKNLSLTLTIPDFTAKTSGQK